MNHKYHLHFTISKENENNSFQGWNHWNAITDSKSFWPIHYRTMLFGYAKRFIIFGWWNKVFFSRLMRHHKRMWTEIQKNSTAMKENRKAASKTLCFIHCYLVKQFSWFEFQMYPRHLYHRKMNRKKQCYMLFTFRRPKGLRSIESHSFKGEFLLSTVSPLFDLFLFFTEIKLECYIQI